MSEPMNDLRTRLRDSEYAKAFGGEIARSAVAATLWRARVEAGLSQRQLADRVGVSQPYVAKLESGEANPTLDRIGRVLATMGWRLVTDTKPLVPETSDQTPFIRVQFTQANATQAFGFPAIWEANNACGVPLTAVLQSASEQEEVTA